MTTDNRTNEPTEAMSNADGQSDVCFRVTSEDAEIQAIEVVMTACNMLDDLDAANRVLNYVKERMQER